MLCNPARTTTDVSPLVHGEAARLTEISNTLARKGLEEMTVPSLLFCLSVSQPTNRGLTSQEKPPGIGQPGNNSYMTVAGIEDPVIRA
jgi:hypothetical protein